MKYWLIFIWGIHLFLHGEIIWQADIQHPFAITIKVSSQQITLDDFLKIEADFYYPSSYELKLENVLNQLTWSANPLTPLLSLHETSISTLPTQEGMEAQHLHATLIPLTIGSIDFSFQSIHFLPKEKSLLPMQILTPIFNLQVLAPSPINPPSFASLIPLEPQFPLNLTHVNRQLFIDNPQRLEEEKRNIQYLLEKHSFPWITTIALIAFGGIGWVTYLTLGRLPKLRLKTELIPSSKEKAHQALQSLEKSTFLKQGLFQTYYTHLTSILLNALEPYVGVNLQKYTTDEISQILKKQPSLSLEKKEEIVIILEQIDQVKFAGQKPSLEASQSFFQKIQHLINQL